MVTFVPDDFIAPTSLRGQGFQLEPLTPTHNVQDYKAWHESFKHIKATPGFEGKSWPMEDFSLEQNLADLDRHEKDFSERIGFTFTVLSTDTGEVIGCLYLYPPKREGYDVDARSWVCADRAELDKPLYEAVNTWIAAEWPWKSVDYAARP
jgi:hypothetical protein